MLFGRSQLLLAGIPTGAALIGLLWLKRRRSNLSLHHTDPGGDNIVLEKQQQEQLLLTQEDIPTELLNIDCTEQADFSIDICEKGDHSNHSSTIDEQVSTTVVRLDLVECIAQNFIDNNYINIGVNSLIIEDSRDSTKRSASNRVEAAELADHQGTVTSTTSSYEQQIPQSVEESKEAVLEETATEVIEGKLTVADTSSSSSAVVAEGKGTVEKEVEISVEVDNSTTVEEKEVITKEGKTEQEIQEGAVGGGITGATMMKTAPTQQLAEKLASLELDTMKISDENSEAEQKGCSERDSANHSPSEVMLASPSISNFSDAHSEGSSDSGKGHSDVATSPSRTPAGGSSLAGDHAPALYEFILPQFIVGRLIGRRGTFLHEIRSSTSTNIYIKRHPDTEKLKICAIEGNQQDIDKALAKIRQKFPLRRFPELTLEKVSFVCVNPLPPLKLEDFRLQLVEGVNNDVILSSLITAAHFFLQQPSHPSYVCLTALNQVMNEVYSTTEAPALDSPIKDAVCAAPTMGGWYRAQIVDIAEETGSSTVRFLDYGGYLALDSNLLRQIRGDLLGLPFQAVECYLANVAPIDQEAWSEEARLFVHNATIGQVLQAQIYEYAEDGTPLVYLYASYGSQVILINEELVMRGYGVLTTTSTASTA